MKTLILVALLLTVTGCGKTINQNEMKEINKACSEKGGLYSVEILPANEKFTLCKNGDTVRIGTLMKEIR